MDNPHKRKPSFSLQDFKNWLSQSPQQKDLNEFFDLSSRGENKTDEMVGKEVYAKVSPKKLLEKIEPEEGGDPESLVEDLVENGGMILALKGKNLLIEVDSGSFYMPRFCVRIMKEEEEKDS